MKQLFIYVLALILILALAACGKKEADLPTWQDQYDLGVKYLSEGNYEEAIIAFTAAIEIDEKRPEAYAGLADVYAAQGDAESLRAILERGVEATGDAGLRERLEELREELFTLLLSEEPLSWLKNNTEDFGDTMTYEDRQIWTFTDENVLLNYLYKRDGDLVIVRMDYRPEDGEGFTYVSDEYPEFYNKTFVKGLCKGYLFNGAFTTWKDFSDSEEERTEVTEGNAVNEFLQGETKTSYIFIRGGESCQISVEYLQYENGALQAPWTDEDGEPCAGRLILKDGTECFSRADGYGDFAENRLIMPGGGMFTE